MQGLLFVVFNPKDGSNLTSARPLLVHSKTRSHTLARTSMEYYPKLSLLFSAHERETRDLGFGFGTNRKGLETVLVGSPLYRHQKNRQTVSADIGCDPQHLGCGPATWS